MACLAASSLVMIARGAPRDFSRFSLEIVAGVVTILAMLVGGYLSARAQGSGGDSAGEGGGGLGTSLGSLLGANVGGAPVPAPRATGGFGGLGRLIDMNGDGNPLDDILGMAGKLIR